MKKINSTATVATKVNGKNETKPYEIFGNVFVAIVALVVVGSGALFG